MNTTSLYSRALQFAVQGYSVMPVGKDKKPLLKSWKHLQAKAADEAQIEEWWNTFPEANIGIITGKVSGITVIDLDTKNGELLTPLTTFTPTYTVRTGNGGYHLYYAYHAGLTISANAYSQFPGLDIRSDGGFVVAPYSTTSYIKDGIPLGGEYIVENAIIPAVFPSSLFPQKKTRRTLSSKIGVSTGGRNDSIASFAGQLLHSAPEKEWTTEVWSAVQRANRTYTPPLSERELETTFESIMNKERERRNTLILSPIQVEGGDDVSIKIRKNGNGNAYKDMANVVAVLSGHPYYKDALRYNTFRQEIEYNSKPIEDKDFVKIQYFMQTDAELHGISEQAVRAAIYHYASLHSYDEAQDWLRSLKWDGTPRLHNWIYQSTGVEDDDYHAGIGAQWFMGMIRRIMEPGCTFDYVLLLVGGQGLGKTSFFRILGGPWYKSYTGAIDNKDFYLALRGAMIVDLDEGAALYRSEAIKIKSIITETHDEYREPYGKVMKKYPRRFVFSMSTNDTEPFRDMTGNRRYWAIDLKEQVQFWWLELHRDQLFAEAYHYWKNKTPIPDVPLDKALASQEDHITEDAWTDMVMETLQKNPLYCSGNDEYFTTAAEIYQKMFPDEDLSRYGSSQSMRITNIFKRAGLDKKRTMIEGNRHVRWVLTPKRAAELKQKHLQDTNDPLQETFDTLP